MSAGSGGDITGLFRELVDAALAEKLAALDTERLRFALQNLASPPLPTSAFDFVLAAEADSDRLSGFTHNAVTPYGMACGGDVPVVVSQAVMDLAPGYLWLGGGAVDVKLRLSTAQLKPSLNAVVCSCSVPRGEEDEEER